MVVNMTQDEIIEMARQADIRDSLEYDHMECDIESLEAFAKLIAQHEREACAKTCEQITNDMSKWHSAYLGVTSETKFIRKTGEIIGQPFIEAIRARKQA
jgi:hypothetical protein